MRSHQCQKEDLGDIQYLSLIGWQRTNLSWTSGKEIAVQVRFCVTAKWDHCYGHGHDCGPDLGDGDGGDDGYLVGVGAEEKEVERNGSNKVDYEPTPDQQIIGNLKKILDKHGKWFW